MQTTLNIRSANGNLPNTTSADTNGIGTDARPAGEKKGYLHLLQNQTLEHLLAGSKHGSQLTSVRSFLVDGVLPSDQNDLDYLALWTVRNRQGGVLNALLGLTPLVVPVNDEATASGLLGAMQSGLSFSGLMLQLDTTVRKDVLDVVVPLLAQAFSGNACLAGIVLFSNDYRSRGLQPLFDVLADVKHLELITVDERLHSDDCAMIATLLSKNKCVRALELTNLDAELADDMSNACARAGKTDLVRHLDGQLHLERLVLCNLPDECQSSLGNFLGSSHALTTLRLRMDGSVVTVPFVAGVRRNTSIERMYLNLTVIADGMQPLLAALAENKGPLTLVSLTTCQGRADAKDSEYIGDFIARNENVASLVWAFSSNAEVNLAQLGPALEKNRRLESLCLMKQFDPGNRHAVSVHNCDWIDANLIPSFTENLRKNGTLTELFMADQVSLVNAVPRKFPLLQQVLDRNLAWQQYACSDAFLSGAVEGLFATMGMPRDTAMVTAGFLMQSKPRVTTAALALVDKASYQHALSARRQAHADMLNQMLPISNDYRNREDMVGLLNGIIVSKQDFSIADFSSIADSPSLGRALLTIMHRSPPDYLYLVKLFCQAAGMEKIRSLMIAACPGEETVDAHLLSMLERSFPPDQEHLLPFVEKELNYHAIDSAAAKLFIGYEIPVMENNRVAKTELASWCLENNQPGVLIAYADICLHKVSIDFKKYSGAFARSMMDKIPLLNNASKLCIEGIPDYEDALVLYRALAGASILEELKIDEGYCGPEFDLIMQGLSLNKRIRVLLLAWRTVSDAPAICATLASLLEANSTIELIDMAVFDDDPEFTDLTRLAAREGRLELEHLNRDDTSSGLDQASSDSDEAPAQ